MQQDPNRFRTVFGGSNLEPGICDVVVTGVDPCLFDGCWVEIKAKESRLREDLCH